MNRAVFGVKGKSAFGSLIEIPTQVPFDYMHLCLQGHMKWLLTQLIENEESDYILGLLKTNNTTNSTDNFFQQNIFF